MHTLMKQNSHTRRIQICTFKLKAFMAVITVNKIWIIPSLKGQEL